MFCQLCVKMCPQQAIEFKPTFEHAVYTRSKLVKYLHDESIENEKDSVIADSMIG